MLRLLTILALFATLQSHAQLNQQQLDSVVNKYVQELYRRGVDTVCIYDEYCVGCLFYTESGKNLCLETFSSLPTYIFWKEKGKVYATRKDACYDFAVTTVSNDSIWRYYNLNKNRIKKEELKAPQYKETVNGKEKITTVEVEHSVYFKITVKVGNDVTTKEINNFYFTKELGVDEVENLSYAFNLQTSLYQWNSILQRIVEDIRKKKLPGKIRSWVFNYTNSLCEEAYWMFDSGQNTLQFIKRSALTQANIVAVSARFAAMLLLAAGYIGIVIMYQFNKLN